MADRQGSCEVRDPVPRLVSLKLNADADRADCLSIANGGLAVGEMTCPVARSSLRTPGPKDKLDH